MAHPNEDERSHPAVIVEHGEKCAEIDVEIAPLILEIWKAGIDTMMSCQEPEPGIVWIEFDSVQDILKFLNIVTQYESGADTHYNRVVYQLSGPMSLPEWEYDFRPLDIFDDQEEQQLYNATCFDATVSVRFPQADVAVLLQRLSEFNASPR